MDQAFSRRDALRFLMVIIAANLLGVPLETIAAEDDGPLPDLDINVSLGGPTRHRIQREYDHMGNGFLRLEDGVPVFHLFTGRGPGRPADDRDWEVRRLTPATYRAIASLFTEAAA
jgi:hypothetical protein